LAEKKNFIIENYNGTDYDTLYPETNSGQVLLDTTAQTATNLPSGSTLDDAIHTITKDGGGFQVGDTLTTARTNLGDKWLLCNGEQYTTIQYPELAPLFQSKELNFVPKGTITLSNLQSNVYDIKIISNESSPSQYIIRSTGPNGNNRPYYTTDLLDFSKYTYNPSVLSSVFGNYTDIAYGNNNWVFLNGTVAKYANGDILTTPLQDIYRATSSIQLSTCIYAHEKYFINGKPSSSGSSVYYIYNSLDSAPITTGNVGGLSELWPITILPNGILVPQPNAYINGSYKNYGVLVSPNGTLTNYYFNLHSSNASEEYWAIFYLNGYYYRIIVPYDVIKYYTYVYKGTSLDNLNTLTATYDYAITLKGFLQLDDKIIFNNGYYMDANGNIKPWANNVVNAEDKYNSNVATDGNVLYRFTSSSSSNQVDPYSCNVAPSFNLPSVSIGDGLYTYIKAKS
jgi:hypothetical protein